MLPGLDDWHITPIAHTLGTQEQYSGNVEISKVYYKPRESSTKNSTRNDFSRSKAKNLRLRTSAKWEDDQAGRETYTFLPTHKIISHKQTTSMRGPLNRASSTDSSMKVIAKAHTTTNIV